jgi:ribonuclease-3
MDLKYRFRDQEFLGRALTHRSAAPLHNERLEYLGDALLGFIMAEHLYQSFPDADEGQLTRARAALVNRARLARIAQELQIAEDVRLGEGERKQGGWRRESLLANTLEAIVGAIYLDGGMDCCRAVVMEWFKTALSEVQPGHGDKDPKTELQEYMQARRLPLPRYETVEIAGAAHHREFTVRCMVTGLEGPVLASGSSRRRAEQRAAELTLRMLRQADAQ